MNQLQLVKKNTDTKTLVQVGNACFGDKFVVIAGPCSVESEEQTLAAARAVKLAGASMLRGGAFKPRTSPYAFQGLGLRGLQILALAREETGLPVVTEVLDTRDLESVCEYADMLQIGSRNMQNFALLREVGRCKKPVLLKRGMNATVEEWLSAAEYILAEGNFQVVLCERGIRTFETFTRNTLALDAVPAVRELSHLPVITDPSHGCGRTSLMPALALASMAAGADGVMLEVHTNPREALSDKDQALTPEGFGAIVGKLRMMEAACTDLR